MIYLDNAATSLYKPPVVTQAVINAINTLGNASRGTNESAIMATYEIYKTRCKIAEFFGCKTPNNVIFTSNATEALNTAILGTIRHGDHVITTDLEHNSVLRPLYELQTSHNVKVDFVKADTQGLINLDDFEKLILPNTKAIICTHASNVTGNMLDIAKIGEIARKNKLLFIVDASQTAGCFPIDMNKMNVDILCFTGHKGLMGLQGTGGLCIGEDIDIKPLKYGGTGVQSYLKHQPKEYPTRLEAGTLNGHGICSLSAAIDFINQTGIENILNHERELMKKFYSGICLIEGVKIYGDFSTFNRAAIVSINIYDYQSNMVCDVLNEEYGILTRSGAHCAPRMHKALNTDNQGVVRFSFGFNNTEKEVDFAIKAIKEIAAR